MSRRKNTPNRENSILKVPEPGKILYEEVGISKDGWIIKRNGRVMDWRPEKAIIIKLWI